MSTPARAAWAPARAPAEPVMPRRQQRIVEGFVAAEFLCQLALLVPAFNAGPLRVVWRIGIFAFSLALIALLRGKTRATAPTVAAIWVMAVIAFEIFNPTGNTVTAVLAQATMYLATLGPLFWMSRLRLDLKVFRRTLHLFWGYYSISTLFGILQVEFPGRFQPNLSPVIVAMGVMANGLKIVLANGQKVWRPMGLTDTPGGAANAGLWAVVFGLGFLLEAQSHRRKLLLQGVYLASMVMGMMCIYLSQVRVLLIVIGVLFGALLLLLWWRGRWRELSIMVAMVAAIGGGGYVLSARVGGKEVTQRVATLTSDRNNTNLVERERGLFIHQAFYDFLPEYPLGAGLGRWGMMNQYFGDNSKPNSGFIYVEIQWQAWVLDGGVPLLLAYLALLGVTMYSLYRFARRRNNPVWLWAALCLAYDIAMMAMTFDYTNFTAEPGLEFWFINALVLTTAYCMERQLQQRGRVDWRWIPPNAG